jgi:hypothetical protein
MYILHGVCRCDFCGKLIYVENAVVQSANSDEAKMGRQHKCLTCLKKENGKESKKRITD